jgi:hypothetical protein
MKKSFEKLGRSLDENRRDERKRKSRGGNNIGEEGSGGQRRMAGARISRGKNKISQGEREVGGVVSRGQPAPQMNKGRRRRAMQQRGPCRLPLHEG